MIKSTELKERFREVLLKAQDLDECSTIDFKLELHPKSHRCELLKDVLAMLNNVERPLEDRWIVYGVEGHSHHLVGVDDRCPDLQDDAAYQQSFNAISPRPHIEFIKGCSDLLDDDGQKAFAAFYIPAENSGAVYEINRPIEDKEPGKKGKRHSLDVGDSFYRLGSSTSRMTEEVRARLRDVGRVSNGLVTEEEWKTYSSSISREIWVIGGWSEDNEADRLIISEVCGTSYEKSVSDFKATFPSSFIETHGYVLDIRVSGLAFEYLGRYLTDHLLDKLAPILSKVFSSQGVFNEEGTSLSCSNSIRRGVASFCALLANSKQQAKNCSSRKIDWFVYTVAAAAFGSGDLRTLKLNDEIMPLLAESCPAAFLRFVSRGDESDCLRESLRQSDGWRAFGLVRAVALLGRKEDYFASAVSSLLMLAEYCSLAERKLIDLLVPWHPQTEARLAAREGAAKKILSANTDSSWRILLGLLPGKNTSVVISPGPAFMSDGAIPESVSTSDFQKISSIYCDCVLKGVGCSPSRLKDVVSCARSFWSVGKLDDYCVQVGRSFSLMSDSESFEGWIELTRLISRRRRLAESSDEAAQYLKALEELEIRVRPEDPYFCALRLFVLRDVELIDSRGQYEESRKALLGLRKESLAKAGGTYPLIIQKLLSDGADPKTLGSTLSDMSMDSACEKWILGFLGDRPDSDAYLMASGYCFRSYFLKGEDWLNAALTRMACKALPNFYAALPACAAVWHRAERELGGRSEEYWRLAGYCCSDESPEEKDHYIISKSKYSDGWMAVEALSDALSDGVRIVPETAFQALESLMAQKELPSGGMLEYYSGSIIEYLESMARGDRLMLLEWSMVGRFSGIEVSYLYERLGSDGRLFAQIVAVSCGIEVDGWKLLAGSRDAAFRVLLNWRDCPGFNSEDSSFDSSVFSNWIRDAVGESKLYELQDYTARIIGENLFFSQKKDGYFLEEDIAQFYESCEAARNGFSVQTVNSRGASTLDGTGAEEEALAEEYEGKAKASEERGYFNLAAMLRGVARDFRSDAEWNREEYALIHGARAK